MNENNNGGCLWLPVLAVAIVLAIAAGCGAPVLNSKGLSWDTSAWTNAQNQRTERERIQANRDIRIAEERGKTTEFVVGMLARALVIVAAVFAAAKSIPPVFGSLATAFAAWAARPHRSQRIEVHITYEQARQIAQPHLLALPGSHLEWLDEEDICGWAVVDDRLQIVKPLQLTDNQYPA